MKIMDTTLRDGEQNAVGCFSANEKLAIAKYLIEKINIDAIEIASTNVSKKDVKAVDMIVDWAKKYNHLDKLEVLTFLKKDSIDWVVEKGIKTANLLAKGAENQLEQLNKSRKEYFSLLKETIDYAINKGLKVNVYLEHWSDGMKNENFVIDVCDILHQKKVNRIMLADTLGILSPEKARDYVKVMAENFPEVKFDFHGHNDYGLATANSLQSAKYVSRLHCTINGMGERTGNTDIAELVVGLKDLYRIETNINEKHLPDLSELVQEYSGFLVASNKPIVGENVFTHACGVHAHGNKKGLYESKLKPERFGKKWSYGLGKTSGTASVEHNLKELGIELSKEQMREVSKKVKELADVKKSVSIDDLPMIVSDVLETPLERKYELNQCYFSPFELGKVSECMVSMQADGKEYSARSTGDGQYDAFMNSVKKVCSLVEKELPKLKNYRVHIPKGGETSAIVKVSITWENGGTYTTQGVHSDQLNAAIIATMNMLNRN